MTLAMCRHCAAPMPAVTRGHPRVYCSRRCVGASKRKAFVCGRCGCTYHRRNASKQQRYCSRRCARAAQPAAIAARWVGAMGLGEPELPLW